MIYLILLIIKAVCSLLLFGKAHMKRYSEVIKRVIILCIGLIIAHLGVTLFLLADLGADPFNVMIQGLFRSVSKGLNSIAHTSFVMQFFADVITHGRVHIVISILIIIVLLFVDRSYIKIGTLICMSCGGPIIDFFEWILSPLFGDGMGMIAKVIVNIAGCCILAFGMTIVIKSEAGTGPNDLVAVVISDKLKKKFSTIRIIVDICFAAVGFILGGTIGLGTVICAFVVGPVAGVFMPINEAWIKKAVKSKE